MRGLIEITKILKTKGKIEIFFKWGGSLNKYFRENIYFYNYDINMEDIPEGIAIIPFLGDILPVVWLTNSILIINELDKNYYESISEVKKAYIKMYPEANFLGEIKVKKIVDYTYESLNKVCQLFSGGVDSVSTYLSIKEKNPELITIWGSDIPIENDFGWKRLEKVVKEFGKNNNSKNIILKSNFRKIYSSRKLTKDFSGQIKTNWWLGIQHGIALISLVIPYAYKNKIKTIYIPASFNKYDQDVKCASYPTIDESIKFGSGNVVHEGFNYTRQDKILLISNYLKETNDKNINLKVCWEGDDGKNCSHCEKCLRTITGLYLSDADPNKLGFNIEKEKIKEIIFNNDIELEVADWEDLQRFLLKNKERFKNENWINWLMNFDIKKHNKDLLFKKNNVFYKLKLKIKKFLKNKN